MAYTKAKPITKKDVAVVARRIIRQEIQRALEKMSRKQEPAIGFHYTPIEREEDDGLDI